MRRYLVAALLTFPALLAHAEGRDAGLVNFVSGDVFYSSPSSGTHRVEAFMKLRDGDRVRVPTGGQISVLFLDGARQERWNGPAIFRVGRTAAEAVSGRPAEVSALPAGSAPHLAQIPELLKLAKLGGVQVRSLNPAAKPEPASREKVQEARAASDAMRKQLPGDDSTPDLYLLSALNEYGLFDEMKVVVDDMLRRQPGNEQAKLIDSWLRKRNSR